MAQWLGAWGGSMDVSRIPSYEAAVHFFWRGDSLGHLLSALQMKNNI